ncbi:MULTISPECIES: VOC family protein [unclassified Knoellia]|uniref:VOC family protein n=1 Tax=Knoellia altitudinis TaxID=3404795 RepID=UPI003614EE33
MTSHLLAVTFDASDPAVLAQFWGGVLGRVMTVDQEGGIVLPPRDDHGFKVRFMPSTKPRVGPNRIHFDLTSSSDEVMQSTIERALGLGGTHLDVGQLPEEGHVVLADPEGNEFCVIPPGNTFLADTDLIGAVNCEGTQAVGYFWSKALTWPLVWDQAQETAIQSPRGGSKVTWSGPPVAQQDGKDRLHLELATSVDGDHEAEVERLVALGASRVDIGQGDVSWVAMVDPDGNEFRVHTPR